MTPFFMVFLLALIPLLILALSLSVVSAFASTSNKTHGACHPYNCNPVPCEAGPSVMCYTAFNVNLNATVQLANPLSNLNTTIDPSGCHIDVVTQTQNVLREATESSDV